MAETSSTGVARPTKRQRELLQFINGFVGTHGYGPSYREIMRGLGYKSVSTVATHVEGLIAKGWLRKRDRSARSLEVMDGGSAPATPQPERPNAAQEKWLVDLVHAHFAAAERDGSAGAEDRLYVLVGALHVLGLGDAARAFQSRLGEADAH